VIHSRTAGIAIAVNMFEFRFVPNSLPIDVVAPPIGTTHFFLLFLSTPGSVAFDVAESYI
jgi:hypothetical protein